MEEEEKPPTKLTIALVLTQEEAAALLAASSQYVMYAKRHPESGLQTAIPLLQDLQRKLVEQARAASMRPTISVAQFE
jgi:hypothetical protein